ncbi:hypothetical protein DERP_009789 [Dermatophagoides pteronyssinus]|uniref:Uncharacterized protein n=1 Tax=Dermatophagoides pteronyssinus TaxID=6956 RepID=A0ABQ8IR63_DERPT|nr:hypothetical protein DERP_009789 [Dermatophagoides pteronyssinus]
MNDEESPSLSVLSSEQQQQRPLQYSMQFQQQQQQQSKLSTKLSNSAQQQQQQQQQLFAQLAHQYSAMHLQWLSNSSVTCNDGTRAGYYIRQSPNGSKRWLIFLEGGWYCMSKQACDQRWYKMRDFMTSFRWSQYKTVSGILSSSPTINPYWWNANHVFIPYCSSDIWSGDQPANHQSSQMTMSFLGSRIIDEVIGELIRSPKYQFLHAKFVLLAGSSAGAAGVMINLDRVAKQIADSGSMADVRGLADSVHPNSSSSTAPCTDGFCPPTETIRGAYRLWNSRVPESCAKQYPQEPWRCFFGYRLYPTLSTPLFIVQFQYDEFQLYMDGIVTGGGGGVGQGGHGFGNGGLINDQERIHYIRSLSEQMIKTLTNVSACFIPSCMAHILLTKLDWYKIPIQDKEGGSKFLKPSSSSSTMTISTLLDSNNNQINSRTSADSSMVIIIIIDRKISTTTSTTTISTLIDSMIQNDDNRYYHQEESSKSLLHTYYQPQSSLSNRNSYWNPSSSSFYPQQQHHELRICHYRLIDKHQYPERNHECPRLQFNHNQPSTTSSNTNDNLFKDFTVMIYDNLNDHFNPDKQQLNLGQNGQQQQHRILMQQINKKWLLFNDIDLNSLQYYSRTLSLKEYHQHFGFTFVQHEKWGKLMSVYIKRSPVEYNYEFYTINNPLQQTSIRRSYQYQTQWILISGFHNSHLILYENEDNEKIQYLKSPLNRQPDANICIDSDHTKIRLISVETKCEQHELESTKNILTKISYGFTYKRHWLYLVSIEEQKIFIINYELFLQKRLNEKYPLQTKSINEFLIDCNSLVVNNDENSLIKIDKEFHYDTGNENDFTTISMIETKTTTTASSLILKFGQGNRIAGIIILILLIMILIVVILFTIFLIFEFYIYPLNQKPRHGFRLRRRHPHGEEVVEEEVEVDETGQQQQQQDYDGNVSDGETSTTTLLSPQTNSQSSLSSEVNIQGIQQQQPSYNLQEQPTPPSAEPLKQRKSPRTGRKSPKTGGKSPKTGRKTKPKSKPKTKPKSIPKLKPELSKPKSIPKPKPDSSQSKSQPELSKSKSIPKSIPKPKPDSSQSKSQPELSKSKSIPKSKPELSKSKPKPKSKPKSKPELSKSKSKSFTPELSKSKSVAAPVAPPPPQSSSKEKRLQSNLEDPMSDTMSETKS